LVDGPASVTMTSGKAAVFGLYVVGKIVVREGKRLPFTVEEAATFDLSLGEGASSEEVDGDTVPSSWNKSFEELANVQAEPSVVMVMGGVDSGKTSFCTYLLSRMLREKSRVAILDGDLGQSDIGPPCTVAYTYAAKPVTDLFNLRAKNAYFIGETSPAGATEKVIEGLTTLKKELLANSPRYVIVNTDGWIEGECAVKYKMQLAEALCPDMLFCIQQKDELAPLLGSLDKFRKIVVESPQVIKQRDQEKRRSLRELGYMKYLKNAKVQSLSLSWMKVEGNDTFGLRKSHMSLRQLGKIYQLLGMKPLHVSELPDRIIVIIGKRRWIGQDKIQKVEEFARKKVVVTRKGEEEGLLVGLYDSNRRFLGIGVVREIDYVRNALKVLTPLSEEPSVVVVGKVKLDKNLKEIPTVLEENHVDFASFKTLF